MAEAWDEMFARPGEPRAAYRSPVRRPAAAVRRRPAGPGRSARPGLHRPRGHLRVRRRGAPVPARPDPADHRRRRVGPVDPTRCASGSRPWSGSWPTCTGAGEVLADGVVPRRLVLTSAHFHREAAGIEPRQRGAGPRQRGRPDPRRGRRVPGARGQPAHPVGRELRHREPARAEPDPAVACSPRPGCTRSTTTRPGCWPRCGPPRRTASPTRAWSCSPRASTTRPTSSTRCWPG